MDSDLNQPSQNAIALLRTMARPRPVAERCDFCNVIIPSAHRHLLEVAQSKVICACDPCALRFEGTIGGRFKLVPREPRLLPNFRMTDALWESFAFPINLTFFYRNSASGKMVAMYPSPAGATESLLPSENWSALETENPALKTLEADVEALLVNRIGNTREYFVTPIDLCYELVGLIRQDWRGFSGGEKVWLGIDRFFATLRERVGLPAGAEEVLSA